jgi:hypothetical protein
MGDGRTNGWRTLVTRYWYDNQWNDDPLPVPPEKPIFKAVEVHPGILYVILVPRLDWEEHQVKVRSHIPGVIPMLPMSAKLVATFYADFPDAATSYVKYHEDDSLEIVNEFWSSD